MSSSAVKEEEGQRRRSAFLLPPYTRAHYKYKAHVIIAEGFAGKERTRGKGRERVGK